MNLKNVIEKQSKKPYLWKSYKKSYKSYEKSYKKVIKVIKKL